MPDKEKTYLLKELTRTIDESDSTAAFCLCQRWILKDALALLKEQKSLLGIQQTADGITFISTGTAQQGEERGLLLGKSLMHEWIFKELLYRGLLTDDIRSVLEQAKRI